MRGGGGDYGPDSSSSPVPSSPAMASAIECHSPYTSPAAHWSSPGASPYLKQPPALTPSSNPAASAGLHPSMSSYSLEQSYLHQNAREDLSVGLPRYQHHSTPVCDRKDFVLNFNGISSFHPSASGSYYHHHHQSVCQDIKPVLCEWTEALKATLLSLFCLLLLSPPRGAARNCNGLTLCTLDSE